jgi:trimeric autotransporter adhesin
MQSRSLRHLVPRVAALLFTTLLAACPSPEPVCVVSAVSLTPGSASLIPGGSQQLSANVSAANCNPAPSVTWSSSNSNVATVSNSGLVTAVAAGSATITGTSLVVSGTASITVAPAPIATLEITPALPTVIVGQTTPLTVTAKDAQGGVLTGRTITWTSLTPSNASVSASGVVTGIAPGNATITASAEGKSAVAVVAVTVPPVASVTVALNAQTLNPGQNTQAVATVRDAQGATLSGRVVIWASSNEAVASVSSTGQVTAISTGTSTISATSEGRSGSSVLTVLQVPVASVSLNLTSTTMRVGEVQAASAIVRDANGNTLTGRTVTYSGSNPTVASVSSAGVITALSAGAVAVTAASEGQFSSQVITVTPSATSISLSLGSTALTVGQSTQATAVALDANGAPVSGVAISFTSSNPAVAPISTSGAITALTPGTTQITASSGTLSRSVTLTVSAAFVPVASVAVTPTTGSIVAGAQLQLAATTRDAGGNVLTGRTVNWSSSNVAIASVNATTGLVTGVATGTVTITASSEGQSATASITVTATPVASLSISPPTISLSVGQTTTLAATPRDANGTALSGRSVFWMSLNPAVAVVNAAGFVSAISAGTATIRATSEGVTADAAITVTPPPPTPENQRLGWAIVDQSAAALNVDYTPATSYAYNASGGGVTARRTGTGAYTVRFARLGKNGISANRENVFVTSIGSAGERCTIDGWFDVNVVDLQVLVSCRSVAGAAQNAQFTVAVIGSNTLSGRYAFQWSGALAGGVAGANASYLFATSGSGVVSNKAGTGDYIAFMGSTNWPRVTAMVSTYGSTTAECTLASWNTTNGDVETRCNATGSGAAVDTRFTLLMAERGRDGRRWGYAWIDNASSALNVAVTPSSPNQAQSNGGSITATRTAVGTYTVRFPGLATGGGANAETILVSAYRTTTIGSCQTETWFVSGADVVVTVHCRDLMTGLKTDSRFTIFMLQ